MCRSAISVTGNIAEGSCRGSDKDFARFLYIARASAGELENYVLVARELGYLTDARAEELEALVGRVGKMLNGLIRYLENNREVRRIPNQRPGTSDK